MPLTETFFIAGFSSLQIVFIVLFFYRRSLEIIHKKFLRQIVAFFSVQLLCIFLILLGGYLEKQKKLYSTLRKPIDEYRYAPPESIRIEGDPTLVQWLTKQKPDLPRPDFANVNTFRNWQSSLRHNLHNIFNISNISSPINIQYRKISATTSAENITRIFLTFTSFDGTTIPAYLFIPTCDNPQPAIIVLHGHIGEYEEGITQTAGLVNSYHNKAALELAKAGFVTFTLEFRGFGYLGPQVNTRHVLVAYNAILGGSFYKAIISRDIKYALDLLQSLPEVDSQRIGITGASFGGDIAVTYAALDERIKVIVSQSVNTSIGVKHGVMGKNTQQPFYTHIIPGHNNYLFQEDMYFLIAPRPLLRINGNQDYFDNPEEFSSTVRQAYKIFKASTRFKFEIVPGGHEYFVQPAVQFFKQYL